MRATHALLLVWVLVACTDVGKSDNPAEPSALVVAGHDAQDVELRDYLKRLQQSVRAAPESAGLRGDLALAYDANGFHEAAAATYAQTAKLAPSEFKWPYYQANSLARTGRLEDALRALDRALSIDPSYGPAWLLRGGWLLDLDRHAEANDAYRHAAERVLDPVSRASATVGLARVSLRQGDSNKASKLLETLAGNFTHPYVLQLLDDASRRLGRNQPPQANASIRSAPLRWPDALQEAKLSYVRGLSGKILVAKEFLAANDPHKALELLEPQLETHPRDRDLLNNLSIAYRLSNRLARSFELLEQGLEAHPDFHAFHYNIAVHYEERGRQQLALLHLDRATQLDPGFVVAHQRKVDLLMRSGKLEDAQAAVEALIRASPADPAVLISAGMIAGALENWPLAIERFRHALRFDPTLARGHLFLGRSLAEIGRFEQARAALAQAEELGVDAQDLGNARERITALDGERAD